MSSSRHIANTPSARAAGDSPQDVTPPDSGQIERVEMWRWKDGSPAPSKCGAERGWHRVPAGKSWLDPSNKDAIEIRTFIPEESVERLAGELAAECARANNLYRALRQARSEGRTE